MNIETLGKKMKVAIFDMDGTIVDSLPAFKILWRRVGEAYYNDSGFTPPLYVDKKIRTTPLVDSALFIKRELSIDCTDDEFVGLVSSAIGDFYDNGAKLKAGVREYLSYLRSSGVRMCVASATAAEYIKYNLKKFGIEEYFEFVVSCVDVGSGKDKPDVYFAALEKFGEDISSACVFEDSFVALETAKKAGFMTVGIHDNGNYEHDRLKAASDFYLDDKMTFNDMISI